MSWIPRTRTARAKRRGATPLCQSRKRIVVGFQRDEESAVALRWAAEEADIRIKKEAGAAHVTDRTHLHVIRCTSRQIGPADLLLEVTQNLGAAHANTPIQPFTTRGGVPKTLVSLSHGAALLVMGTRAATGESMRWWTRVFKSKSRRAGAYATCPVAIIREDKSWRGQKQGDSTGHAIVVGVTDNYSARDALRWAAEEALMRSRPLLVVYADTRTRAPVPVDDWYKVDWSRADSAMRHLPQAPPPASPEAATFIEELLTEVMLGELSTVQTCVLIRRTDPYDALRDELAEAELLVLGSSRYGFSKRLRPGSLTRNLLDESPCPVVLLPSPMEDRSDGIAGAREEVESEVLQA